MAKKLKSVKILMCRVCWCVHCVVIRLRHTGHVNILTNFNFLAITRILFLHHIIVNIYVLDFAHDNTDVLCEHREDGHVDRNM